MREVKKSVLVHYSAEQIYELVDAVERYPEFLPWCSGAGVSHRDQNTTRATIQINYRGVKQSFTTENRKKPGQAMFIHLVDGPFKALDGSWRFTPLGEAGCKIDFQLAYEFSSRILEKLVGPVFNYIANSMVEAFVRRAGEVYGAR